MSSFIINVTNGSETGTIVPDVGFRYTDNLNELNEADIKISGTGSVRRGLLVIGANVEIKRNDTREFYGFIDMIDYLEGGTVTFHASGYEKWLALENGSYANSPYKATASATIAGEVITESNYFTAGTVEAGFNTDFRISTSESLYNALSNLARKTTQDVGIDYANLEVDILDHKGSSSVVATFNKGIDIKNVRVTHGYPSGNKIKVFGKGDGSEQITGTSSDATSIAAYGEVTRAVIDRSVMSSTEAGKLADAELALTKDPTKIYDFEIMNINTALVSGDHLYLNAKDIDLSNEEVRVVGLARGMQGKTEYLAAQVTNPAYKSLMKTRNKILAGVDKSVRDNASYMQGSGNLSQWGRGINANSSVALKVNFEVSSAYFQDEAGNLRVGAMTLDYDVDKYNEQYGGASFTGSDPQVQNSSALTQPDVENSSGYTLPDVENSSGYEQPSVAGNSGTSWAGSSIGSSSGTSVSCASGAWTTICSVNTTNTDKGCYANFYVAGVSGGSEDMQIKVDNTGSISANSAHYGSYHDGFRDTSFHEIHAIRVGGDGLNDSIRVRVYPFTGAIVLDGYLSVYQSDHSHDDGSYAAANHAHGDGGYKAENHLHDSGGLKAADHLHTPGNYDLNAADLNHISIGDGIGEAGSVFASGIDIHLDFWNTGTSSWDLDKHTIIGTGKTLDRNVDITDGGTYPDVAGLWRVRILTNHATPDFVQSIISISHNLDS